MMRFMNILSLALSIALLPINFALGADAPVYKDGLLTIPRVNTAEQVGQYQDVTFKLTEQGNWQLLSGKTTGEAVAFGATAVELALLEKVDVVKTDTFPVQVFLRASGGYSRCASLGQINQRLENNRFDVAFTVNFLALNPAVAGCLPDVVLFVRTIPLPVYGLSAGVYSYSVNNGTNPGPGTTIPGGTGTFELTADNKYPGDY